MNQDLTFYRLRPDAQLVLEKFIGEDELPVEVTRLVLGVQYVDQPGLGPGGVTQTQVAAIRVYGLEDGVEVEEDESGPEPDPDQCSHTTPPPKLSPNEKRHLRARREVQQLMSSIAATRVKSFKHHDPNVKQFVTRRDLNTKKDLLISCFERDVDQQ